MTTEIVHVFDSVWDALEETPEAAADMRMRSEMMMAGRQATEELEGNVPASLSER